MVAAVLLALTVVQTHTVRAMVCQTSLEWYRVVRLHPWSGKIWFWDVPPAANCGTSVAKVSFTFPVTWGAVGDLKQRKPLQVVSLTIRQLSPYR